MFIFISHLLDEKYFKVPSIQASTLRVIKKRWDTDNRMIQAWKLLEANQRQVEMHTLRLPWEKVDALGLKKEKYHVLWLNKIMKVMGDLPHYIVLLLAII